MINFTRISVFAVLSVSIVLLASGCTNQTGTEIQPPQLVWQDEFEGPANQSPDPAKWDYDIGGDGWGNNQLEFDTDRPENVSLDGNGNLAITARKESYLGREYTSARLLTRDKYHPTYDPHQLGTGPTEPRFSIQRRQAMITVHQEEIFMRSIALWLIGIPIPVIIILHLMGVI